MPDSRAKHSGPASRLAIVVVLLVGLFAASRVDRSWSPADEGMLGESAVRVLRGQLPHRDFDAVYTGGLAFYDAAIMKVAGVDLLWLRVALLLAYFVWLGMLWWLARRWLAPWSAAAAVGLAGLLTLPQWPAALPSWYNLFLLTAGLCFLVRHAESGRSAYLAAAGLAAGVSILFKIVGLYALAGVLLYLAIQAAMDERGGGRRSQAGTLLVGAGAVVLTAMVVLLVRTQWGPGAFLVFVVPPAAVGLCATELGRRAGGVDPGRLLARVGLVVGAAAIPVALFAAYYALEGGLGALAYGTLVQPWIRLSDAAQTLPGPPVLAAGLLSAVPLVVAARAGSRARWTTAVTSALVLGALLVLEGKGVVARYAVECLRVWAVVAVVWGAARLLRQRPSGDPTPRAELGALVAGTAMWGLVQFPFAAEFYVFYVVPLTVVLLAALLETAEARARGGLRPVALLYAVVVAGYALVNSQHTLGPSTARMTGVRASLRVPPGDWAAYRALVDTLHAVDPGPWVYATPDGPEIPYLADRMNPTRTLYDFLDDPVGRTRRIMDELRRKHVRVAVLKRPGLFSGPVPRDLLDSLETRFPRVIHVGPFTVLVRPDPDRVTWRATPRGP